MQIGLGTAAIGRPQYINIRQKEATPFSLDAFRQKGFSMLDAAYAQGVRYFDTAPGYGLAEQLLIDWVATKNDATIEIATKWGYTYVANFDPNAEQHEVKEHSLSKLNEQWAQSKVILPSLSTYQIHSATFATGVLDTPPILNRLHELKKQHGIKIGITTTGANQVDVIKKAMNITVADEPLFTVYQVTYNILDQSLSEVATALHANGSRMIIKEALANGRFFPNEQYPHYHKLYAALERMAQKYDVGIDAIALRFCWDSIAPFTVLSGAAIPEHLSANLKTADIQLETADLEELANFKVDPAIYWEERKKLGWN
ncbi:MAG: aldo/keto reductase [Saprospiraceae bacterium]